MWDPFAVPESEKESNFVDPDYFQKLQYQYSREHSAESSLPPTPIWRIASADQEVPSSPGTPRQRVTVEDDPDEVRSVPPLNNHISSKAFCPGYLANFFTVQGELGRGGKGVVLLVKHKLAGHALGQYACKRVPVGDNHQWLERVLTEVQLLQGLSHQNIVAYRHAWLEDFQLSTFSPSVPCLFILQQYCNAGDLHAYVLGTKQSQPNSEQLKERVRRRSKGQFDQAEDTFVPHLLQLDEIILLVRDITSGIHYLHSNDLIHRDLKPKNCLLHRDNQRLRVLVSDFGETQNVGDMRSSSGATGTLSYCAPEVIVSDQNSGAFGQFTMKSDVFSLGMTIYFMCFGKVPYSCADEINDENEDIDQLREEIGAWSGLDDHPRVRADLPDRLYKFLALLLSRDPSQRPSTEDIMRAVHEPEIQTSQHVPGGGGERHASPRRKWSEGVSPSSPGESNAVETEHKLVSRASAFGLVRRKSRRTSEGERHPPRLPRLLPPPESKSNVLVLAWEAMKYSNHHALLTLRLIAFAFKTWSLYTVCRPFTPEPIIAVILLILATFDMAGMTRNVGEVFGFAALHYLVLGIAKPFKLICSAR